MKQAESGLLKTLKGVVCATITPMTRDSEIDLPSLTSLIDYLAVCGIDGIYPNGTNGEGILLTKDERMLVSETVAKSNAGRMAAYIQCTAATTQETCEHVMHADHIKVDGIGIMTPFFFHQDDFSLEAFYSNILDDTSFSKNVYVYNIPSHSNNDISPQLLDRLMSANDNIRGIKYSAPDLIRMQEYLNVTVRKPDVLIGCDRLFLQCLTMGGIGTVSGPAMVFGRRFARLYRCYLDGDMEGAIKTQRAIVDTERRLAGIPGIPAIKTMLSMQGVITCDQCRKPMRTLTHDETRTLGHVLDEYNKEY